MARTPIYAAGGIVVRGTSKRPRVAVVQRSKDERWVLPRGKLKRDEDPMVGARREVVEETGHRVRVHEFLGAITYRVRGRSKVVQFWRMQAYERPSRDIMSDIAAVEWLPLAAAVRRLSYPLERLFLLHAGRHALKRRKRKPQKKKRQVRRKTGLKSRHKTKAAPARHARKTRAHARKASAPRARSRAAKSRAVKARGHGARPRRHKRRATPPLRIAAAKQAIPTKISSPAQIASAPPAAAPAKRPTVLARMLGRLGR
jgi:8-oxo-dGTP diphosphatase